MARDQIRTGCETAGPDQTKNLKTWPERGSRHKTLKSFLVILTLIALHRLYYYPWSWPNIAPGTKPSIGSVTDPKLLPTGSCTSLTCFPTRADSDKLSVFSPVRGPVTLSELHALSILHQCHCGEMDKAFSSLCVTSSLNRWKCAQSFRVGSILLGGTAT
jgi:hypothetical protein